MRHEQTVNLTIAEALLATISTPPLFTSISIFKDAATFEYTGADWTLSNPTQEIIAEAHATFGRDERVACLLNLGSGHPGIVSFPEGTGLLEWNRFLEALATDGQRMAECLESQMGNLGLYYRFSITSGLERSAVLEPGDILTHTSAYLAKTSVSRKMDICVDSLKVRDGVISLGQLSMLHSLSSSTCTDTLRTPWQPDHPISSTSSTHKNIRHARRTMGVYQKYLARST